MIKGHARVSTDGQTGGFSNSFQEFLCGSGGKKAREGFVEMQFRSDFKKIIEMPPRCWS